MLGLRLLVSVSVPYTSVFYTLDNKVNDSCYMPRFNVIKQVLFFVNTSLTINKHDYSTIETIPSGGYRIVSRTYHYRKFLKKIKLFSLAFRENKDNENP